MDSETSIEWYVSTDLVEYEAALQTMETRVDGILDGAPELVWLVEHPPLYTAGTSAQAIDLLDENRFPVYTTGRGGEFTYHGPGQRVCYTMLNLASRSRDIRQFVYDLEEWIITTLAAFGVEGERRNGRVGIWVKHNVEGSPNLREDKIAAIGVRVRRWVTFHGISINLEPDLDHYSGIVPCGISDFGTTSLKALGISISMDDLDCALQRSFEDVFGRKTFNRFD